MTDLLTALKSLVADIEAMRYRPNWFGPFSNFEEEDDQKSITAMTIEWPNLAISLEAAKQAIAANTPPFWHAHNPWKDRAVYVPLEELLACGANGQIRDPRQDLGDRLDAYILLPGELNHLCGGIRYGKDSTAYLSPWFDQARLQALLEKHRPKEGESKA